MKGILVVAAALLLSGAAHAQGGNLSGSAISPITINAAPILSYARINRQCNCTVASGRNDGPYFPSSFATYDQAIQEGELSLKASRLGPAEAARLNREQKKASPQPASFVVVQDDRGRVVVTSSKP